MMKTGDTNKKTHDHNPEMIVYVCICSEHALLAKNELLINNFESHRKVVYITVNVPCQSSIKYTISKHNTLNPYGPYQKIMYNS